MYTHRAKEMHLLNRQIAHAYKINQDVWPHPLTCARFSTFSTRRHMLMYAHFCIMSTFAS